MLNSQGESVQIGTAVVLGHLMPTLPDRQQREVYPDIVIRCNYARSPRVVLAIEGVLSALR